MIGIFAHEFNCGDFSKVVHKNGMPTVAYVKWLEKKVQDGRRIAFANRRRACYEVGKEIDNWLQATEEPGPSGRRERGYWLEARLGEARRIAFAHRHNLPEKARDELDLWLGKNVAKASRRPALDPPAWLYTQPRQREVENVLAWLDR